MTTLKDTAQECATLIRSGYPLLYLYSFEEERLQTMCEAIAKTLKRELWVWTRTEGFLKEKAVKELSSLTDPLEMIRETQKIPKNTLILLKDFHPYLHDPLVVRALRSTISHLKKNHQTFLLTAPVLYLPRELEKDVFVVDVPLPDFQEIQTFVEQFFAQNAKDKKLSAEEQGDLVRSAQGLTLAEMNRVFSRFLCSKNGNSAHSAVEFIHQEKSQILRRTRVLEFHQEAKDLTSVGGLDQLKIWLKQRALAFSEKARDFGLPQPKGLFLLGVQGCGKSLMAKATAGMWRLPLLRMDVAALVTQSSGSQESLSLMVDALKVADSLAPVVLWLDEIEKAFGGLNEDGSVARNFGTFITWMQEKKSSVFVVATANSIKNLPPELLRKGRFDEIFFVDLPNIHERKEIFEIHLIARKREADKFAIAELAEKAEGFSGAEIEQIIIDALFKAFSEKRQLENRDLREAIEETVPLSTTMEEMIKELKEWARTRARRASLDTKRIDYFSQ